VSVQEFVGSAGVAFREGLLHQAHVGGGGFLPSDELTAAGGPFAFLRALPLPQNCSQPHGEHHVQGDEEAGDCRFAPAPAPDSPRNTGGAGADGLVAQESSEVPIQSLGRGVAAARFLLQAFQAHGLQIDRHPGAEQARRNRLLVDHFSKVSVMVSPAKGGRPVSR